LVLFVKNFFVHKNQKTYTRALLQESSSKVLMLLYHCFTSLPMIYPFFYFKVK